MQIFLNVIYISVLIAVSDPPPTINLICSRQFQSNGKFDVYVKWTIAERSQGLLEAIDKFILTRQLIDTSLDTDVVIEVYPTISIIPNVSSSMCKLYLPSPALLSINLKNVFSATRLTRLSILLL